MADVPKDLLDEIQKLEDLFIVDGNKLKQVTDQFVSELRRGLEQNDATIVGPSRFSCSLRLTPVAYESHVVHGLPRWQRNGYLPGP